MMAELGGWVWCLRGICSIVLLWGLAALLAQRGYHVRK